MTHYNELSQNAKVREGVYELLKHFFDGGVTQVLLSATERQMLTDQVKTLKLDGFFSEICGLDNIHAHSKIALAEAWREENPNARVLVLGDTVHDAAVAKAIGADCFLVEGGHQSRNTLESTGYAVVEDLWQIFDRVR